MQLIRLMHMDTAYCVWIWYSTCVWIGTGILRLDRLDWTATYPDTGRAFIGQACQLGLPFLKPTRHVSKTDWSGNHDFNQSQLSLLPPQCKWRPAGTTNLLPNTVQEAHKIQMICFQSPSKIMLGWHFQLDPIVLAWEQVGGLDHSKLLVLKYGRVINTSHEVMEAVWAAIVALCPKPSMGEWKRLMNDHPHDSHSKH